MTTDELIAFWASVEVEGRRIEQIYAMILNNLPKEKAYLQTEDESKAWDVIAEDVKQNPAPEGSFYEIPSFN